MTKNTNICDITFRNMKAKLFQFHGNRRPQYYGTWRKKSKIVSGSCPLAEEIGIDYNVSLSANQRKKILN